MRFQFDAQSASTLLLIVGLVLVGQLVPRLIINGNPDDYTGEEGAFAEYALLSAHRSIGGSLEPFINTGFRVVAITPLPHTEDNGLCSFLLGGDERARIELSQTYEALIRGYTVFGIPYLTMTVHCNGSSWLERSILL